MSAPDTNIDTQERRHKPVLTGIRLSLIFVAILFLGWLAWLAAMGNSPGEEEAVVPGAPAVQTDEGPVEGSGVTVVD